jgi:hypothetical protein
LIARKSWRRFRPTTLNTESIHWAGTEAPDGHKFAGFIFGQSPNDPSVGSGVSNAGLFDILRNIDSTGATPQGQPNHFNPHGILFFDAGTATDADHPRGGFVPSDAKAPAHPGAYMDRWGTEYFIVIGSGPDMPLRILPYKDFQNKKAPKVGVAVFSLGKDQRLGTKGDGFFKNPSTSINSDDIISWQ